MAKNPNPPRGLARPTADEEALFQEAMVDAEPIERHTTPPIDAEKPNTPAAPSTAKPRRYRQPAPTPTAQLPGPRPELKVGKAADLDRRTMDRLRKGQMRPEDRLDLHGMTADRALSALSGFLASAQLGGKRCVLIITGKGSLKNGGGVIRRELPLWLNAPGNRARVLGFAGARPADGGGGAFYVLLKRRR